MKIKIVFLLICLGLFVWEPSVFAVGNIHIGRVKIHPKLSYKAEYNDNIFYENQNTQSDVIHIITPGVDVSFSGNEGNFLSAGYRLSVARYSDYDENNYKDHRADFAGGYKTGTGFFLKVWDNYQNTGDPFGSDEEFRLGVQTKRWNNLAKLNAGYEFAEKYSIEGIYRNFRERYDLTADQVRDRTGNTYGAALFYKLTGKTALFGQYLHQKIEFDRQDSGLIANAALMTVWNSANSQDHEINSYFIGARVIPGGILTGELKLGYSTIEFQNSADVNGNPYNDDSYFIMEASIDYHPLEKTSLSLTIQRSKQVSVSADTAGDVSATYLKTDAGLELTQNFTHRISMNAGLDWSHRDYLDVSPGNPDKYFNLYTAKLGADYLIGSWLTVGLEYQYRDNQASDTQYSTDEYTVNSVGIKVTGSF